MLKLAPEKIILIFIFWILPWQLMAADRYGDFASIDYFIDEQYFVATSAQNSWAVGEILPIMSQNSRIGVIGYAEVIYSQGSRSGRNELRLKLVRQSRRYLIQRGDFLKHLNLISENKDYTGTTDLLVKQTAVPISSKYRPLFYQGFFIGETAQSLYRNELLVNYVGNVYYGIWDNVSIGSLVPMNIFGKPNLSTKWKFFDTEATTLAAGLNYVKLVQEKTETINLNLYWDSTSSDSLVSHVFVSLGLATWDGASETTAFKALGSSSFQTGYEVILDNWDRFLIGPSYNFDKKALGGYLSYIWIWDRFHAQVSINTTNVVQMKVDAADGYYGFFDLFWRY